MVGQNAYVPERVRDLEHVDVSLDGYDLDGLHLLSRFGRDGQGPGKKPQKQKKAEGPEPDRLPWGSAHNSSERGRKGVVTEPVPR